MPTRSVKVWAVFRNTVILAAFLLAQSRSPFPAPPAKPALPSVQEMIDARTDVWGEAALRQPGGPSYEFFRDLLPPLRYVNTAFRHYPIVLSAPLSASKARFVGNGSAINARANKKPMWREPGVPVTFFAGDPPTTFGQELERLDGPRYADGYLPIVQLAYRCGGVTYEQEAFAPVAPSFADHGAVLVRFAARGSSRGRVRAQIGVGGPLTAGERTVRNAQGHALVAFDSNWRWDASRNELEAAPAADRPALLAVFTRPTSSPVAALTPAAYAEHRAACARTWNELLARGARLETPEPIVNNAWRSLIIGNFMIAVGDRMHYSAGNAYDHLYEGECGDATRSLLYFGFLDDARRMVGPLLDFQRQDTRFHVAGHKLQLLRDYYWLSRDREYLRAREPVWKGVVEFIRSNRQPSNGLMPRDNYAGDIKQQVFSLKSNANCWRGLRDVAAMLDETGRPEEAAPLAREAREFREAILAAVAKSERRDVEPPFIPIALLDNEEPHDPLTATRLGSYYCLVSPYVLGSGVFGVDSERERWLLGYLQQHGGVALGLIRCQPHQGEFNGEPGLDDLYGIRYTLTLLRRDERERALVGFYAKLAQGLTRDTFIGGEGTRFRHGDARGRSMYLPPNSASNAMFLIVLRFLLVQDWDLNDDGRPDTLRLLYGIPRQWLEDGCRVKLERAPTAFGEVSIETESRLRAGEVRVRLTAPPRPLGQTLLRVPLPAGWQVLGATVGTDRLPLRTDGAVDLTGRAGALAVRFEVGRAASPPGPPTRP